ncbi:MAG: FkbM family methyltransferase [Deltaproteobacteria bacterium]|nr:FkbM family methyltransferase [Deltaproteobacteria bacterium]
MLIEQCLRRYPVYIADIGASGGIDHRWRQFSSQVRAILFEPDPREFETLRKTSSDDYIVLNTALSDNSGEIEFYLCRKQQVSSVFRPNLTFLKMFPEEGRFDIIGTKKLATDTLDNQLEMNGITQTDFIKVDTQGYELPILRGAINSLKDAIGLEIEVEFSPLYENQPLFSDINDFVVNLGFDLFDIKRYFWKRKDIMNYGNYRKGQLVFGDALYFRTPENIISSPNVSEIKIIHSIIVYLAYGYFDLVETVSRLAYNNGLLSNDLFSEVLSFLTKSRKNRFLIDFRGKGRIHNIFLKIANILSVGGWHSGADKYIGNM